MIAASIYCYLIKYKVKHLLPIHNINNKLNKFYIDSLNWKCKHKKPYILLLISNNIKIDEKSYLLYWIFDNKKYLKIYSVNSLYLILRYLNRSPEEINGNKYLTLVPANERKEKIKKNEKLWIKIRYLIRSRTKNFDDYDRKCMKIKFDSDDELSLNQMIEILTIKELFFLKITNIIYKFS